MNKIRVVGLGMLLSAYLLSTNCFANTKELKTHEEIKTISVESRDNYKNTIENEISIGNVKYQLKDIKEQENKANLTKEKEILETKIVNTNDKYSVLNQFETKKQIEEDGYIGTLELQIDSLDIKVNNSYTEQYKVTITKNYNNVTQNELNNIPKTIEQNGTTYYLTNPVWNITQTQAIDGEAIPTLYSGVMNYEGVKERTIVTSYIATANYKGTLEKETIENITIKANYEEIPQEEKEYNLPAVTTATTGIVICSGIIILKRKNAKVYNFKDGEWVLVKRIKVSDKQGIIDITPIMPTTSKYKICLSQNLYNKLIGENVTIKYFDKQFVYLVKDKEFEIFV